MRYLRFIFFPFALLYGFVLFCRNKFYDWQIFKSVSFPKPVIVIGNLSLGGTGKTPHTEMLIKLFESVNKTPAVLSRGYGRSTKGFLFLTEKSTVREVGDEPLMMKHKFKKTVFAVSENRANGIQQILGKHKHTDIVLLDDAFQHRAVKAHASILITDYHNLFYNDFVLPVGRLREWKSGAKRSHVIIVSKCPADLPNNEQEKIKSEIKKHSAAPVFLTKLVYGKPMNIHSNESTDLKLTDVLCITGIAKPQPFITYLKNNTSSVTHLAYTDHYRFSVADAEHIEKKFNDMTSNNKIIVTTEKDITRLKEVAPLANLPLYYIPIEVDLLNNTYNSFANILSQLTEKTDL
jgi:tetraacyldisaccharide 4'-kinase